MRGQGFVTASVGADPAIQHFEDATAWARWLAHNHAIANAVWLQIPRAHSGGAGVPIHDRGREDVEAGRWSKT